MPYGKLNVGFRHWGSSKLDKQHRKELKRDAFTEEVVHTIEVVSGHKKQAMTYVGAGLAALVIGVAIYFYRDNTSATRQRDLQEAFQVKAATITGAPTSQAQGKLQYSTQDEKTKAEQKAFENVVTKHSGTNEAAVGEMHLGMMAADAGNMDLAIKYFQNAASYSSADYASLANYKLAQAYIGTGKEADAEKVLRALVDKPTSLVSKEESLIMLARLISKTRKDEAKKLLEPLEKSKSEVINKNAQMVLAEISK